MINEIINQINKDFNDEDKKIKKELQEVRKGKIKSRVFFNKYKDPICVVPSRQEKVYSYVDKYTEISKEDFKKVEDYEKRIKKLREQQKEFIRGLIK
jgi:pyruvate/2-oxoacid:ferredoxin oxidoreductase alpha subunit